MNFEQVGDEIWKLQKGQTGPVVCVLGGTHGNEQTGITLIRQLVEDVHAGKLVLACGTLYLILGNPKAIERGTRGSQDHQDLNRCFTTDVMTKPLDGTYEAKRAKELAEILVQADVSIDIHATNKPSVPMICANRSPRHEAVFEWFDCDRVLLDPRFVLGGEQVTTDEFVDAHGGVGVCYESGQATDLSCVQQIKTSILNVLRAQQMLADDVDPQPRFAHKQYFELDQLIPLTDKGFAFAPGRGEQSFEPFNQDDVLGLIGDQPLVAPYDGVIMFPKVPELWKVGAPVCYFAIKHL